VRTYEDLEYVNIGQVVNSLSRRPQRRGRRDVYIAVVKRLGHPQELVSIIRMQKWGVREHLDAIPIDHPLARMTQPYAVGRNTRYKQMMARLQDSLTTAASRQRFEAEGFGWRYQPNSAP